MGDAEFVADDIQGDVRHVVVGPGKNFRIGPQKCDKFGPKRRTEGGADPDLPIPLACGVTPSSRGWSGRSNPPLPFGMVMVETARDSRVARADS
ncbi:unnamed protein product [Prunus brigantina]